MPLVATTFIATSTESVSQVYQQHTLRYLSAATPYEDVGLPAQAVG